MRLGLNNLSKLKKNNDFFYEAISNGTLIVSLFDNNFACQFNLNIR